MFRELNILKVFFESPSKEFSVRDVAKRIKITPATASKQLKDLTKKRFLSYKRERAADLYKANIDSDDYKDLKVYYNIRKLKESGFIEALNKYYLKPAIILFGSAARGIDTEDSDFDIVVISENVKAFPEIKKYEQKLNRRIQMFNVKELNDLRNKHLVNNVLNGIKIQGEVLWT